jgi:deferrochelatase/peroxidase EfeB
MALGSYARRFFVVKGAPLATCPFKDNPEFAQDKDKANDFDYRVRGVPGVSSKVITDYYCPFTAHTRKTAPRDLDPLVQRKYLESGAIVRAGLPYGPEVSQVFFRLQVLNLADTLL